MDRCIELLAIVVQVCVERVDTVDRIDWPAAGILCVNIRPTHSLERRSIEPSLTGQFGSGYELCSMHSIVCTLFGSQFTA